MSVSDPLIRDIKGCVLAFLEEIKINRGINDVNSILLLFCQNIEKVFNTGLVSTHNTLGFVKHVDAWNWLEKITHDKDNEIAFPYLNCVENVKHCKKVTTNVGRFRLLIRLCLIRKCLHIPIEYLKTSKKFNVFYKENSIIGDDILLEILLSVLRQCSKISFKLDASITAFLDISWIIPEVLTLEVVPCNSLGMTVSFAGEKAVIMSVRDNSVVAENGKIEVGDVLETLNGFIISLSVKGKLRTIFKSCKGRPIVLTVIKAIYTNSKQIYGPIINLLKQVNLDPYILRNRIMNTEEKSKELTRVRMANGSEFKVTYMGYVDVGSRGDVKLIDKALSTLLSPMFSLTTDCGSKYERVKKTVIFDMGELGVRCTDPVTMAVILKHSFMEISSCGSASALPNYFAYIAGDKYCNMANNFTCFIFFAKSCDTACRILQSIGQGFQRTHYAV